MRVLRLDVSFLEDCAVDVFYTELLVMEVANDSLSWSRI